MIFLIWLMLVSILGLFAWFSNVKNTLIPTIVFCIISFPLLIGIQHIASRVPKCDLNNKTYKVLSAQVTLDMQGDPEYVYLFLDAKPPFSCYMDFNDDVGKKMEEKRQKEGNGAFLIISGGDMDIAFPPESTPKGVPQ